MAIPSQFYLSSSDTNIFRNSRECKLIKTVIGKETNVTFLWVSISPGIPGEQLGSVAEDINKLLLAPKHKGYYFDNAKEYPLYVYILLPKTQMDYINTISFGEYEIVGWGEINLHPHGY